MGSLGGADADSRNARLSRLLSEAGFTDATGRIARKRFARAVSEAAAARGSSRAYSHTYVSRWLAGTVPRDTATRRAIADALAARLGRVVGPDELGFVVSDREVASVGLIYPSRPGQAVTSLAQLLDADLDGRHELVDARPDRALWHDASLAWLVGTQRKLDVAAASPRIGSSDVERLQVTRAMFDRLDDRFGGEHARRPLVQFLRSELPILLRAGGTARVRRGMYCAAAEITQLAAWMSYDAGHHGLAQRYFVQALALADAAEDRLLAAGILDAMSHQAAFLGRYRDAATLARAARLGTEALRVPLLTSHFHIMEARALARAKDARGCDEAMAAAVREFERHGGDDGPEWIRYFDEAELAAELGHCNRDLGRAAKATDWAGRALTSASGEHARSDFFVTMVLADAHLDEGELAEGCRIALQALQLGESIRSARCSAYVDEFRRRLHRYRDHEAVREFVEQAAALRLWGGHAQ